MTMERVPEPELMDDGEQARAYAEADFEESNSLFLALYEEVFGDAPTGGHVLDLGCGPGDISMRFARKFAGCDVDAVDGSDAMLEFGRKAMANEPGLVDRVRFVRAVLPADPLPREKYDIIISNSLLHHLHEPGGLWQCIERYAAPGARVQVMDLARCESTKRAAELVATYAGDAPEVLRQDFYNSLLAAFTPAEVELQLTTAGFHGFVVRTVSDRHLLATGRMPS